MTINHDNKNNNNVIDYAAFNAKEYFKCQLL